MSKKYTSEDVRLCRQSADELIGYLYLLIEEIGIKYYGEWPVTEREEYEHQEVKINFDLDEEIPF